MLKKVAGVSLAVITSIGSLAGCGGQPSAAGTATEAPEDQTGVLSEEQALDAAINHYKNNTPGYETGAEENDYWDVSTEDAGQIVVSYHSYTGAINRYYVDVNSGETYVTEYVPGIIEDERRTGEVFDIRDYLEGAGR